MLSNNLPGLVNSLLSVLGTVHDHTTFAKRWNLSMTQVLFVELLHNGSFVDDEFIVDESWLHNLRLNRRSEGEIAKVQELVVPEMLRELRNMEGYLWKYLQQARTLRQRKPGCRLLENINYLDPQ